uniref:Odorant binding protein 27 n=1 Tax=Holotrichia oblita TaxID=644536 RepID=A0A3S8UUQ6_HOLOL|nr:odorant binding protein 27 [Holotrichia oblita]
MKFIVLVLSALTFINAYDYEDYYFDDIIMEQFELPHGRLQRNMENKSTNGDSCCNKFFKPRSPSTKKEECLKELGITKLPKLSKITEEQQQQVKCYYECRFRNHIDANGELFRAKQPQLRKIYKERMEWLAPKIDDIFDKCLTNLKPAEKVENECNDIGLRFTYCFWREAQLECPLDEQVNPEECQVLQEYLKKHNHILPTP